ncbi:MAG: type II secretion system protein [bacterium]
MNNKGFTLIELILVIAILGILAVSAMPKIFSLSEEALTASIEGTVAGIAAGITLYGAKQMALTGLETYPAQLDNTLNGQTCDVGDPCFSEVLKDPFDKKRIKKNSNTVYVIKGNLKQPLTYTYDSTLGTFTKQ